MHRANLRKARSLEAIANAPSLFVDLTDQAIFDLYTREWVKVRVEGVSAEPAMPVSARLARHVDQRGQACNDAAPLPRPVSFEERILNLRRQTFREDFEKQPTFKEDFEKQPTFKEDFEKQPAVPASGLAPTCAPKGLSAGALSTHAIPPRSWGGHGSTSRA